MNSLSQLPLSINYLHSHVNLSLFHLCLLLQILAFNLHLYAQFLCHPIYLLSLVLDIRLNTLIFIPLATSGRHIHQ